MQPEALVPHHTKVDASNRITVPEHFSNRIPWMKSGEVRGWLLLVGEGRYRLLSDEQVMGDPELEPVRQLILEGKSAAVAAPTSIADPYDSALVARLTPVKITPPGPGWRISFPKALEVFLPENCNRKKFSILFSLEGYWEIWYTDKLTRAAVSFQSED